MTEQWTMPAWLVVAAAVVSVSSVLAVLVLARTVGSVRRDVTELRRRAEQDRVPTPVAARREVVAAGPDYLPTMLDEETRSVPAAVVEPGVFAELVVRESVLHTASLLHGLRRALSPENRNRIRFEMRREIRRHRRERLAQDRDARRAWADQQRTAA